MHQEGLLQGSSRVRKRMGWELGEGRSARQPQTSGKQSPTGSKQTTLGVRQADVSPTWAINWTGTPFRKQQILLPGVFLI